MRPIGFSTGALALGDFRRALKMLQGKAVNAIELSALRTYELPSLVDSVASLDLRPYQYISIHAPSSFTREQEPEIVDQLKTLAKRNWPIVLHPDAIHRVELWRSFGELLCIENMDKRKPIGRTMIELSGVFCDFPDAWFCLDMAHARQVDSSMTETYLLLKRFGGRLRQLHISEVNTTSKHDRISEGASRAFQEIAGLIPENIPAILETPVKEFEIEEELEKASRTLLTEVTLA
jgi:hypothetical protein